jgi:anti-sigma regulatory factor (Ser/Thr protein kinase)
MVQAGPSRTFQLSFPGDLEYIPSVRKFVSEVLLATNFDPKFAYRSEIIVDEICNNAVSYGCIRPDAAIELSCSVHGNDKIEFTVRDEGGRKEDIQKLEVAVSTDPRSEPIDAETNAKKTSLGLEIVRMLSKEVSLEVDTNNVTSIRVVKVREDETEGQSAN